MPMAFATLDSYLRVIIRDKVRRCLVHAGRQVHVDHNQHGLRFAVCGAARILAYAEGGSSAQTFVDGIGWIIADDASTDSPGWAPLVAALRL